MTEFASFLIPTQEVSKDKKNGILLQALNFNEPETPISIFERAERKCDDNMRIFLRLRPGNDDCYETPNEYDVVAIPPPESASFRNFLHGYGKTSQKFTFSKLFSGDTCQDIVFDETTKPFLNDFVNGSDRLLFTYGTTSSGKTYTMNGQKRNVGIIPRSLISVFNSVKLSNDPSFMPTDFAEVTHLLNPDLQKILKDKATLLKISEKESTDVLKFFSDQEQNDAYNLCSSNEEYQTTFWVTFTEIYNEMIYDLLDVTQLQSNNNNRNLKRPMLEIRTARNGGSYVKNLSCFPVYSAEEAYRLLLVGRRSQKTGSTRLNQNSSRSHSIFTIRAVRTNTSSRYLTRVSNFSFCDLAGSERTEKAQTTGVSQKEANNINSSLLALGRCIEILRRNQINPGNMNLVPFRDSKLTRLFQTYLTGNGTASMIVCVNPDRKLFDETMQVLKFSALAREVVLQEKEKVDEPQTLRKSHFCRLGLMTPARKSHRLTWDSDNDLTEEDFELTMQDEDELDEEFTEERYIEIIEELKSELLATKAEKRASESRIKMQLNEEFAQTIMKMENEHSDQMQLLRDQMNSKLLRVAKSERDNAYRQLKKRKRDHESSNEEDEEKIANLENELANRVKEVKRLESQLKDAEEESADVRQTADILSQKLEKMSIIARQNEFLAASAQSELRTLKQKVPEKIESAIQTDDDNISANISDSSIITVEADSSLHSNCSRQNRFSSFSSDQKVRVRNVVEPPPQPKNFFGPLQSPESTAFKPEPLTVKKKEHLFEINEEDLVDNEPDNRSFLQHEADFKIIELETKLSSQQLELEEKTVSLKTMKDRVEELERAMTESTKKLVSRDKTVMVLNDQQRYMDITVDSIAKKMGVLPKDGEVDVPRKLELILGQVKKDVLCPVVEEEDVGAENMVPVRVTRSHNPEMAGRTRRKK